MSADPSRLLSQMGTTCGALLSELQIIWDEVGESDAEKDKMLLELEQECLEVYRRKVDQANKSRAQLRQAIADAEAELAAICSGMGERPVHIRQSDHCAGNLKAELRVILPEIEEMRKRKSDRKNQFTEVLKEIQQLKNDIYDTGVYGADNIAVDETDLSLRKFEELQKELQALQQEKNERLKKVLEHLSCLYSCCSVLGLDFKQIITEIHPSLGESDVSKNISDDTIAKLGTSIQRLRDVKVQRMQQLQDLATSLLELWNLMDTPLEEQQAFQKVTCNIAAAEDEITEPDMLSADFISYVKAEVSRLEELKASIMKELLLKKKAELDDICRKTYLIPESVDSINLAIDAVESGAVDASCVLEQIELQISRVKEEAFSRKEILEKVEKWKAACEEESWLEEYNRDDNRYNAGRGAHLALKRAEKARALVNKLPAMVDALVAKTKAWENEKEINFTYDGIRLLSMLEEYILLRQEKELERKRQRDQKKLQEQLLTEQEALYGSKPSPMKNQSAKKGRRLSCGGASAGPSSGRLSLGGTMLHTPKPDLVLSTKATPNTRNTKKHDHMNQDGPRDDGFAAVLSGRRGLDLDDHPAKQHSFNLESSREVGSPPSTRKPFSNAANILEGLNRKHSEMLQKTLTSNNTTPFSTPSKTATYTAEPENRTPLAMVAIPAPSTPSTVSRPMQMVTTPAPPALHITASKPASAAATSIHEEIEYSFEERRAGFVLPRSTQ